MVERKRRWSDEVDEYLDESVNEILWDRKVDHVEVFEVGEEVHVLCNLGQVDKKDIKLGATRTLLKVRTGYNTEHVYLPTEVNPGSARATFKNGVLQVIFSKR